VVLFSYASFFFSHQTKELYWSELSKSGLLFLVFDFITFI
jgi:hypothetical protein